MEINLKPAMLSATTFLHKTGVTKVPICHDTFINKKKSEVT